MTEPSQPSARPLPRWCLLIEPILDHLELHPGTGFGELRRSFGTTTGILTRALQELRYRELIRLEGRALDARYYLGARPSLRVAGPVVTPLHLPLTGSERRMTHDRLQHFKYAMGMGLDPNLVLHILDAVEAQIRTLQPRLAANDPLADRLQYTLHCIGTIRRDRFAPEGAER